MESQIKLPELPEGIFCHACKSCKSVSSRQESKKLGNIHIMRTCPLPTAEATTAVPAARLSNPGNLILALATEGFLASSGADSIISSSFTPLSSGGQLSTTSLTSPCDSWSNLASATTLLSSWLALGASSLKVVRKPFSRACEVVVNFV